MQLKRIGQRVHQDQRGQIAAGFVVLLLVFIGLMAFTVDLGFWLLDRRGGQNQVDASVLAGVQTLPKPVADQSKAADDAQDWLERNSRTDQGQVISECGLDVDDGYDMLASPSAVPGSVFAFANRDTAQEDEDSPLYDTIRACIKRDGLVIFARAFDVVGVTVPAVAAAGVEMEPVRYALMAMNPDDCVGGDGHQSLYLHGTPDITLGGGGGSYTATPCNNSGLFLQGDAQMEGHHHDICGGNYGGGGTLTGPVTAGVCNLPDPWALEEQPIPGACRANNKYNSPLDPADGVYCKSVNINGHYTLLPGVHIFREGLSMSSSNSSITGSDVVLYFTCSSGTQCCPAPHSCTNVPEQASITGGDITLSAPDELPHIVIWIDRTADEKNKSLIDMRGNGDWTINGHIYNWGGTVEVGGNNSGEGRSLDGTVLGDKILWRGTASYTITWDETFAPRNPVIYLVE